MRGGLKLLLAVAFAALSTTGFVACGSDDPGPGSGTTADASTAPAGEPSSTGEADSSSGEASAAFRTPGGDNSIQNFGEEAETEERDAANAALAAFMRARAADDWAGQCASLAQDAVAPLEDLAAGSPQIRGAGCAAILEALGAGAPPSTRANTLTDGIASLRVEGDRGFALYHGAEGVDYFVPMVREDDEWKLGALAPSEFP